jgi:hypothetical protein
VGGKRGSSQAHRNRTAVSAARAKSSHSAQSEPHKQSIWKRALGGSVRWIGGLTTAVVLAAVTAAVTVVVTQHVTARDTPATPARHGPPVKIDSVTVMRTETQGGLYVFQRAVDLSRSELRSLNQLRHGPGDDAWFRSHGGVDPSPSNVQLVVEGNEDRPTRITNLTLIKNCQVPLDGTLFDDPPAGGQPALPINFNLDSPQALAQTPDGHDYFPSSTILLNPGEVQVIAITASTRLHYCRYSLRLTVLAGGQTTIENVTDDGRPFQVTALHEPISQYHALYTGGVDNVSTGDFIRADPRTHGSGL